MRKRSILAFAGSLLMATIASTGSAQAAEGVAHCDTTGASGSMYYQAFDGILGTHYVDLSVHDHNEDGHHVRVRLLAKDTNGDLIKWPWRSWTDGAHSGYTWHTTAQSDKGLRLVGVEVARFEKSKLLNSCKDWE